MNRNRPRIPQFPERTTPNTEEIQLEDVHRRWQVSSPQSSAEENGGHPTHYPQRVQSMHRLEGTRSLSNSRTASMGRSVIAYPVFGTGKDDLENHANLIVAKLEEEPDLMEDSPISENLRREALQDMPQCLSVKRYVRDKLSKTVNRKSKRKPIGFWKQFKYSRSMMFTKFATSVKTFLSTMELWYSSLKKIEGNFGSGVGSFFKFLRFMFLINLCLTIVSLLFVVLPQIIYNSHGHNGYSHANFTWHNIFTGNGYLQSSILFYGSYSNATIDLSSVKYGIPEAYFFTMTFLYLICLAVFGYSVAVSYRRSFIETEGGLKNVFANKIFCGWDYSISNRSAANLKSRAVYHELKELLDETMREKETPSCMDRFTSIMTQITLNFILLLTYSGIGYLVWYLMKESDEENWSPIYTAISINVFMFVCPAIFNALVRYEGYGAKTQLRITFFRVFILGAIIIAVLLTYRLLQTGRCWETSLGQEIYRLMIVDFIFSVIITPTLDIVSFAIRRIFNIGDMHFDISRHTMQIIYNQSLFWVGFMFSPLLAAISAVKLFVMWHVYELIVLKLCTPSTKSWRAARTRTWFLMMAFLSLLIILGLHVYISTYISCSQCGPFQSYNYILELLTEGVLHLKGHSKSFKFLLLFTKPGFIALVLIAMCCWVYYLRSKANAQRNIVSIYRNMLVWEARDKDYLLQKINGLVNGWHYDQKMSRYFDPIMFAPRINRNDDGDTVFDDAHRQGGMDDINRPYKKYT